MIAAAAITVVIFIFLWNYLARRALTDAVEVSFRLSSEGAYADEELGFSEVIRNTGFLPVPAAEICFRIEKGISFREAENVTESDYLYKRDVFSMLGREQITRQYCILCGRRGHYHISQAVVRSTVYPSHRVYEQPVSTDENFYVYARRVSVRDVLTSMETLAAEDESSRRVPEDPFAFANIRQYTETDPMRAVNWKATAKTGQLMVNTYQSVRDTEFAVYLDVEDRNIVKRSECVEECISLAASLCQQLLRRGRRVSLAVNALPDGTAPVCLGPDRGEAYRLQLEQALAADFTDVRTRSVKGLMLEAPPEGLLPVIISANVSAGMTGDVEEVVGSHGSALLVAVSDDIGQDLPGRSGNGRIKVVRRGITP